MTNNMRDRAVMDKFEIIEVAAVSRWCRDTGDWARLVECFHSDGNVDTSWFSGSPQQFAEQSKKMMPGRDPAAPHIQGNSRGGSHPEGSGGMAGGWIVFQHHIWS